MGGGVKSAPHAGSNQMDESDNPLEVRTVSKKTKVVDVVGGWQLRQSRSGFRWQAGPKQFWDPIGGKWAREAPWSLSAEEAGRGLPIEQRRAKEAQELTRLDDEFHTLKNRGFFGK